MKLRKENIFSWFGHLTKKIIIIINGFTPGDFNSPDKLENNHMVLLIFKFLFIIIEVGP